MEIGDCFRLVEGGVTVGTTEGGSKGGLDKISRIRVPYLSPEHLFTGIFFVLDAC